MVRHSKELDLLREDNETLKKEHLKALKIITNLKENIIKLQSDLDSWKKYYEELLTENNKLLDFLRKFKIDIENVGDELGFEI